MGRRPDPAVTELKAQIAARLDKALTLPVGLVLHAHTARDYALRIAKQVKKTDYRWDSLAIRPGSTPDEIWIVHKDHPK